jgi:hypothetical protein
MEGPRTGISSLGPYGGKKALRLNGAADGGYFLRRADFEHQ